MAEHIDVDVSGILRRELTLETAGDALIEMVVRTANGRLTAAEALGHREFVMTKLYRSASRAVGGGYRPPAPQSPHVGGFRPDHSSAGGVVRAPAPLLLAAAHSLDARHRGRDA